MHGDVLMLHRRFDELLEVLRRRFISNKRLGHVPPSTGPPRTGRNARAVPSKNLRRFRANYNAELRACPAPLCGTRKARRDCPALGQTICAVCCGTKRLVEIQCPDDCVYLPSAREHPAAVVKRQQEHDVAVLLPTIQRISPSGSTSCSFSFTRSSRVTSPRASPACVDEDVADAAARWPRRSKRRRAASSTSTRRNRRRRSGSRRAHGDARGDARQQGATVYDGEVAIALRAIEQGARDDAEDRRRATPPI